MKQSKSVMEKEMFVIKTAKSTDIDNILEFLEKAFFPYEVLVSSSGERYEKNIDDSAYLARLLLHNLSVIAVIPMGNNRERIIGTCMNGESTRETWKGKEKRADTVANPLIRNIMKLIITAQKETNLFDNESINKIFDIHFLTVDPEFRGQNIGVKLCERSIEIARARQFQLVHIGCTGVYSIKVAEKLGMECVFSIYYKDYKGDDGQPVFNPPQPHTEFKCFILTV